MPFCFDDKDDSSYLKQNRYWWARSLRVRDEVDREDSKVHYETCAKCDAATSYGKRYCLGHILSMPAATIVAIMNDFIECLDAKEVTKTRKEKAFHSAKLKKRKLRTKGLTDARLG